MSIFIDSDRIFLCSFPFNPSPQTLQAVFLLISAQDYHRDSSASHFPFSAVLQLSLVSVSPAAPWRADHGLLLSTCGKAAAAPAVSALEPWSVLVLCQSSLLITPTQASPAVPMPCHDNAFSCLPHPPHCPSVLLRCLALPGAHPIPAPFFPNLPQ